jgi:hypothetical protein
MALLLAIGIILALGQLSDTLGTTLVGRSRYACPTSQISTEAPPGSDLGTFLTEVRYLGLPDTISTIDPSLDEQLRIAFRKHPAVEQVLAVHRDGNHPPRLELRFRKAVLKVALRGHESSDRGVDAHGILLPASMPLDAAARLTPGLLPPTVSAGEVWPDSDIVRALELLQAYPAKQLDRTARGWRIHRLDGTTISVE